MYVKSIHCFSICLSTGLLWRQKCNITFDLPSSSKYPNPLTAWQNFEEERERRRIELQQKMSSDNLFTVIRRFFDEYSSTTPQRLKLVDAYLAYIMLTGIVQFLYCLLVGTFPFNSFLSGFISCVGSFILAGM